MAGSCPASPSSILGQSIGGVLASQVLARALLYRADSGWHEPCLSVYSMEPAVQHTGHAPGVCSLGAIPASTLPGIFRILHVLMHGVQNNVQYAKFHTKNRLIFKPHLMRGSKGVLCSC